MIRYPLNVILVAITISYHFNIVGIAIAHLRSVPVEVRNFRYYLARLLITTSQLASPLSF